MLEALGDFVAAELPESRMLELDHEDICPEDTVRAMCSDALGVQLVFIPEEYGGMGGGAFDSYRVCERMARIDIGLATSVVRHLPRQRPDPDGRHRGADARSGWAASPSEGIVFAYGATEPEAGSDLGAMTTIATPVDDGRPDHRLPDHRAQAVDQQRQHRRRLHDPGHGSRRAVLVHRRDAAPRASPRHRRRTSTASGCPTPPRSSSTTSSCRPRTWSAASRGAGWSRPSRSSATPG